MQTQSNTRQLLRLRNPAAAMPFEHAEPPETSAQPVLDMSASRIDSGSLLRGGKSVHIAHNGAVYLLQTTKLGKLILTK